MLANITDSNSIQVDKDVHCFAVWSDWSACEDDCMMRRTYAVRGRPLFGTRKASTNAVLTKNAVYYVAIVSAGSVTKPSSPGMVIIVTMKMDSRKLWNVITVNASRTALASGHLGVWEAHDLTTDLTIYLQDCWGNLFYQYRYLCVGT